MLAIKSSYGVSILIFGANSMWLASIICIKGCKVWCAKFSFDNLFLGVENMR